MGDLYLKNNTFFALASSTPDYYNGTTWKGSLPELTVFSGAELKVGALQEFFEIAAESWGWLYFNHLEQIWRRIELFALSSPVQESGSGVGPYSAASSRETPLPAWSTPAIQDLSPIIPGTTGGRQTDLTYVYHGVETGLSGTGASFDLPCSMNIFVDQAGTTSAFTLFCIGPAPRGSDYPTISIAWTELPQNTVNGHLDLENDLGKPNSKWNSQNFGPLWGSWKQVGDLNGPSALSRGGLETVSGILTYFWNQADYSDGQVAWRFVSSQYHPHDPQLAPFWSGAVQMQDSSGDPIGSDGFVAGKYAADGSWIVPDVACTSLDDETVLIAMLLPGPPGQGGTLKFYEYKNEGISVDQQRDYVWKAAREATLPATTLSKMAGLAGDPLSLALSMEWYETYETATGQDGIGTPLRWLGMSVVDASGSQAGLVIVPEDTANTDQFFDFSKPANFATFGVTSNPLICRDAVGRLVVSYNTMLMASPVNQENLITLVVPTNSPPSLVDLSKYSSQVRVGEWAAGKTASACYWMSSTPESTPAAVEGPYKPSPPNPPNTPWYPDEGVCRYPVYRFLCYANSPPRCAVTLMGWCEEVQGISGNPTFQDKVSIILQGIIDAPIPAPAKNAKYIAQNRQPPDSYGSFVYSQKTVDGVESSVESSFGWGVQTSGQFTVGMGPAWDASVQRATSKSFSSTTLYDSGYNQPFNFGIAMPGGVLDSRGQAVEVDKVTFTGRRYQFVVPGPAPVNGVHPIVVADDVAVFTGLTAQFSDRSSTPYSFAPYTVKPGDLHSYTREAISATMTGLKMNPEGEDYVARVTANALQVYTVDPTDQDGKTTTTTPTPGPSFSVAWNGTASPGTGYIAKTSQVFKEQGVQFTTHDYAGISGGFDFSGSSGVVSFGVASASYTALAGIDLSTDNLSGTSQDNGWQISIDQTLPGDGTERNASEGVEPGFCGEYSYDVYYLPADTDWTNELVNVLLGKIPDDHSTADALNPSTVAVGSMPWRVLFVVTKINEMCSEWTDDTGATHPAGWYDTYPPDPALYIPPSAWGDTTQ